MTDETVHQALFGYARGHRMLASSRELPSQSLHVLRDATDTAVERDGNRYLTVLPLPEVRAQALIRTWRGEEWLRPGSVWSHVLLVDFVILANLPRLSGLVSLFRRPHVDPADQEPGLSGYRHPLSVPPMGRLADAPGHIDHALAARVLGAVYGHQGRMMVTVDHAAAAEATLLAIYEQQWPRLRRQFAFRTRLRSSEGSTQYDLEVVEKSRSGNGPAVPSFPWVHRLVDDLAEGGRSDVRRFLQTFGSEAGAGRADMAGLVATYISLVEDAPRVALAAVCEEFPASQQMRALKRALLGVARGRAWTPPSWPAADPERLALLFAAPAETLDYEDLNVGDRIADAVRTRPAAAAEALHMLDLEKLPPAHARTVISAVLANADDHVAAEIACDQPDLGVLLVSQRPMLLNHPGVWAALDADLLVEAFDGADPQQQDATLRALLNEEAADPLIMLCSSAPARWWRLLFLSGHSGVPTTRLLRDAQVLRRVLQRVGAAAIGAPPRDPHTPEELLALLFGAELSSGIWRHVPADAWVQLWRRVETDPTLAPEGAARDRVATVALLAATSSGPRQLRTAAWLAAFPHLHRALADAGFDEEAWQSLSAALPAAPDWDRCLRLRRGAVGQIRRDRWGVDETTVLLTATGSFRDEMLGELQITPTRKKGKHWLRQLVDALRL